MTSFVRPDWLGPTPFNSYEGYYSGHSTQVLYAWLDVPWAYTSGSLYDTHVNALKGSKKDLRAMYRFYINLTTQKLLR